jgi:hypothetical protein
MVQQLETIWAIPPKVRYVIEYITKELKIGNKTDICTSMPCKYSTLV